MPVRVEKTPKWGVQCSGALIEKAPGLGEAANDHRNGARRNGRPTLQSVHRVVNDNLSIHDSAAEPVRAHDFGYMARIHAWWFHISGMHRKTLA